MPRRNSELLELGCLLASLSLFYFLLIPLAVSDPQDFGLDQGLPPSFSPRLVAILAAVLMLFRVIRLLLATQDLSYAEPTDEDDTSASFSPRTIAGMAAAALFALVLVPVLGFLLGGAVLVLSLLVIMGEYRPTVLVLHPLLVMLAIWALFERLLSVRLPPGLLFTD